MKLSQRWPFFVAVLLFAAFSIAQDVSFSGGGSGDGADAIHTGDVANVTGLTNSAGASLSVNASPYLGYRNITGLGWTNVPGTNCSFCLPGTTPYGSLVFDAPCGPNDVTNTYYLGTQDPFSTRQVNSPEFGIWNANGDWDMVFWGNGSFGPGNGAIDFGYRAAAWPGTGKTNAYGETDYVIRIGRIASQQTILHVRDLDRTTTLFQINTNKNITLGAAGATLTLPAATTVSGSLTASAGGSLSGTFNGGTISPTTLNVSSGGSLAGTFSGSPVLSGNPSFSGNVSLTSTNATTVFSNAPIFAASMLWSTNAVAGFGSKTSPKTNGVWGTVLKVAFRLFGTPGAEAGVAIYVHAHTHFHSTGKTSQSFTDWDVWTSYGTNSMSPEVYLPPNARWWATNYAGTATFIKATTRRAP
jgi:hypothetical protein